VREITGPMLGTEESRSSFSPGQRATHGIVDIRRNAGELTLERLQSLPMLSWIRE